DRFEWTACLARSSSPQSFDLPRNAAGCAARQMPFFPRRRRGSLITIWLEVRVLPAPPRIHVFCRHVETRRKCPLTAGFPNASFESLVLRKGQTADLDLSLCGEKSRSWYRKGVVARASPRSVACWMRTPAEICKCEEVESGLGQTKPLKLQRPFGRRITQGGPRSLEYWPTLGAG